jgi:geranylgeranyl diphosphate synthase, type I
MHDVRARVDARLRQFLDDKREEALGISADSIELVDGVTSLTLRGGKRMRPIVAAGAFTAIAPNASLDPCIEVGAALELLQTYLLIHDDWMDLDDERRGGPSVYAALRHKHGDDHLGASLAVLAGDLASVYASELMAHVEFPKGSRGLDAFWRIQREVFFGQQLDLTQTLDVERMYDLKTGSYTVRGPLVIGAELAGASRETVDFLERMAHPLGISFQLRDELLGTFGSPEILGKPAGNDLRAGKITMLIAEARREISDRERAPIERVLGDRDASDEAIAAATELLTKHGIRARVEARLRLLTESADRMLAEGPVPSERLREIVVLLTARDR